MPSQKFNWGTQRAYLNSSVDMQTFLLSGIPTVRDISGKSLENGILLAVWIFYEKSCSSYPILEHEYPTRWACVNSSSFSLRLNTDKYEHVPHFKTYIQWFKLCEFLFFQNWTFLCGRCRKDITCLRTVCEIEQTITKYQMWSQSCFK